MKKIRSFPDREGLLEAVFAAGHMVANFGGEWHADDPEAVEAIIRDFVAPMPELGRAQMAWFMAYTGLEGIRGRALGVLRTTDRGAYALIEAHRAQERFGFEATARIIERLRPFADVAEAEALGEEALRAAWAEAAAVAV
ncbi:MAG: hypothetical protein ACO3O6_11475 [Gemmobacter sp.]|jgi:hypothetical protein